ncbi:MAG: YiiX family permuted papain-like enzyme [Bacteroidetes bacterium]|nr:YiiX family permuted papain-like enzyme [Bacteroidota bacterium]
MKKSIFPIIITSVIFLLVFTTYSISNKSGLDFWNDKKSYPSTGDELKDGDLIFHTSISTQSEAIQLATKSAYTHCGIIFKEGNTFYVFEAVGPVKRTLLSEWIASGKNGKYVVKRLKSADQVLTPEVLSKMMEIGRGFNGKAYDKAFEWSDEKMYCSELIWKIYQRATGIELGQLEKLGDFDLSSSTVQQIIRNRYGNKIPLNESVISPVAVFESDKLVTIREN